MSLLVLSEADVAQITSEFSPDELVNLMAQVFFRLSSGSSPGASGIDQPDRLSLSMVHHRSLFMPSRISSIGTAVKVVSVPTSTAPSAVKRRGLPASTLVLDEQTGSVKAIVNAKHLTALRNAAGSLLASRLLLSSDSRPRTLLAIGAGAQISSHVFLFLTSFPSITACTIFNRSINARLISLVSSLKERFPSVRFEMGELPAASSTTPNSNMRLDEVQDAGLRSHVRNANVIITATSSTVPFFPSEYVSPGTHLCLIGSYTPDMHEIDRDLVKRGGTIVVDSRVACLVRLDCLTYGNVFAYQESIRMHFLGQHEAGELISAKLGPSDLVELGELIEFPVDDLKDGDSWTIRDEKIKEIKTSGDVTIFKSVGVGVQDVAIATAVVSSAERNEIGVWIKEYDGNAV
ncbi:hypothetical protein AcW1_003287 [Taiwanofungus camphoratus]|nr:hypothetical protein AcW1_003287 [Antrodia cinnamomea]